MANLNLNGATVEIDDEIVDVIDYMNKNGMRTVCCCSGTLSRHEENIRSYTENFDVAFSKRPRLICGAYISLMECEYTRNLLANALDLGLESDVQSALNETDAYNQYATGRIAIIRYLNLYGESNELVKNLVIGTREGTMIPSEKSLAMVDACLNSISKTEQYDSQISVMLNTQDTFELEDDKQGKCTILYVTCQCKPKTFKAKDVSMFLEKEFGLKSIDYAHHNTRDIPRSYSFATDKHPACKVVLRDYEPRELQKVITAIVNHKFTPSN